MKKELKMQCVPDTRFNYLYYIYLKLRCIKIVIELFFVLTFWLPKFIRAYIGIGLHIL